MTRTPVDPYLASPFRVDWLDARLSANEREDIERAVAAKAADVLRAARFGAMLYERAGTEIEVKVWLETGFDPVFVSVYLEPRLGKHYFLVMDATGRDRLAAVVFQRAASVTGSETLEETRRFLAVARDVLATTDGSDLGGFVMGVQDAYAREDRPDRR